MIDALPAMPTRDSLNMMLPARVAGGSSALGLCRSVRTATARTSALCGMHLASVRCLKGGAARLFFTVGGL